VPISTIIILIVILLVASVVGSIIFTKKEQAAAIRRQQVASFRVKADEAQDLYDGLQNAGMDKIVYHFLLDRILANLKGAYDIDPSAPGVKLRLRSASSTMDSFDSITFSVQMPSAMIELHSLIGRLNKLVKYLVILFQKRILPEQLYQQLMPAVQQTLLKFDAEGHMKMGHQAANDGQPGTARQSYLHAKEKLLEYGDEDPYVQAQLAKVDELIQTLEQHEDPDIANTDAEGAPTQAGQGNVADSTSTAEEETTVEAESRDAVATQAELNKRSEGDEGGFTPKKKW